MSKITIGFVGYGYWGKNILRNLMGLPNVEVKYVCDLNSKNLELAHKTYPDIPCMTSSYNDILKDIFVDAVVLATTPETHYELVSQALHFDKHVFVEKPMTDNSKDANAIVSLSKQMGKVLMVGHTFLYNPAINDLKKLIESKKLGKIHYIDFVMTNLGKYQKHNVLWDLGPHGVSIILHLLGNPEIKDVKANGISAVQKGLIDVAYLTMYFKNNCFANIHFSWLNPNKVRQLTVVGSKKMATFDDISPLEKLRIYDKGIAKKQEFNSWGESLVGYRHGNIVIPQSSTGEPLKAELQHFIDCIINKKTPITDGEHGAKVVQIIELGEKYLK